MSQRCESCAYSLVVGVGERECRFVPPTIVVLKDGGVMSAWPRVKADSFCAQYKPKAEA